MTQSSHQSNNYYSKVSERRNPNGGIYLSASNASRPPEAVKEQRRIKGLILNPILM